MSVALRPLMCMMTAGGWTPWRSASNHPQNLSLDHCSKVAYGARIVKNCCLKYLRRNRITC